MSNATAGEAAKLRERPAVRGIGMDSADHRTHPSVGECVEPADATAMLSGPVDTEHLHEHDVGEMLLEADPIFGAAPSFDRERQVRKHIGDYSLFLTGMFPESLNHHHLGKARLEDAVDFVRAGKESYYIVSKFEHFEYAKVAPLFRSMSQQFEQLVYGLNQMKNELAEMQYPIFVKPKEFIM